MAELRSVLIAIGGQCVMSFGTTKMQVLCADNLDSLHMVRMFKVKHAQQASPMH